MAAAGGALAAAPLIANVPGFDPTMPMVDVLLDGRCLSDSNAMKATIAWKRWRRSTPRPLKSPAPRPRPSSFPAPPPVAAPAPVPAPAPAPASPRGRAPGMQLAQQTFRLRRRLRLRSRHLQRYGEASPSLPSSYPKRRPRGGHRREPRRCGGRRVVAGAAAEQPFYALSAAEGGRGGGPHSRRPSSSSSSSSSSSGNKPQLGKVKAKEEEASRDSSPRRRCLHFLHLNLEVCRGVVLRSK